MRIAAQPPSADFPFADHFDRLGQVAHETQQALGGSWELYQDGMQLLYDIYAVASTRLAVPYPDRKDAALLTSTQAVSALTSAGVLLLRGDAARSIVCSRQGFEELLHYLACLNVDGVARRYLEGRTPKPGEIRKRIMAQPLVVETYDWLSKPAHGGIENPRMMHGEGWLPLFTGRAHLPGAHIATATAVHVIAIGLPLVAAGLGVSNEPWHGPWLNRFTAFTDAWRSTIRTWLPDLEGAIEVAEHSSRAVAPT